VRSRYWYWWGNGPVDVGHRQGGRAVHRGRRWEWAGWRGAGEVSTCWG
jgi:hypothetical protein